MFCSMIRTDTKTCIFNLPSADFFFERPDRLAPSEPILPPTYSTRDESQAKGDNCFNP